MMFDEGLEGPLLTHEAELAKGNLCLPQQPPAQPRCHHVP